MQKTILTPAQPKPQPPFWAVVLQLYALTLKLYPSAFRLAFADEMLDVFAMSLREANGHSALAWLVCREVFTLPLSVMSVHRQAHIQLPPAIRRTRQNHWFVRIMGGLFSLFLLSTFRVVLSPAYNLYVQAVPFVISIVIACICLLIALIWARIGGLLTIASGAAIGTCMSLYIYVMGFDQMGWFMTVFVGLVWALPFLIFGLLFYELGRFSRQQSISA